MRTLCLGSILGLIAGGTVFSTANAQAAAYASVWPKGARTADVTEALAFLNRQSPLPPLTASPQLDSAAARHAADEAQANPPGHTGTDGSSVRDRVQGAGVFSMIVAEDISVAQDTGAGVVQSLIVDAGNLTRMHRADLINPLVKFVGVGCGPNKTFHTITVIDLTGAIMSR